VPGADYTLGLSIILDNAYCFVFGQIFIIEDLETLIILRSAERVRCMSIGLPDAFISVNIIEALGKLLTNAGEMVRGYSAIAVGYLTFNPIAKRQTLNMSVSTAAPFITSLWQGYDVL